MLKRFLRARPFLALAFATIVIGVLWHLSGLKKEDSAPLYYAVYTLGLPFITVTQLMHAAIQNRALAGILSILLGLIPYLAADWLLQRFARGKTGV